MRYTQKYLEENNIKQDYSQEELNEIVSAVAGAAKKIADVTGISGLVKKGAAEFVSQIFKPESESRATATFQGSETGARARRFGAELGDAAAKKITEFPARRRAKKAAADQAAATAARVKEAEEGAESSDLEAGFKEKRKKK